MAYNRNIMVYGELVYFNGTKNSFQIHVCDICWATHAGVCDSTAVTRNMLQDFIGKKPSGDFLV